MVNCWIYMSTSVCFFFRLSRLSFKSTILASNILSISSSLAKSALISMRSHFYLAIVNRSMFFYKYHFILNDMLTASFSSACFMLFDWSESLMTSTLFFSSARYFTFWSQESSIASRSYCIVLYWWDCRAGR